MSRLSSFLLVGMLACAPLAARANDYRYPSPRDLQVDVQGSDATVSISMPSYTDVPTVDVVRLGPGGIEYLGTLGWELSEPVEIVETECLWDSVIDPDWLDEDCDGDGELDCQGVCNPFGRFEIEDPCVPVRSGSSEVIYYAGGDSLWEYVWSTHVTVDIAHVDSCQDDPIFTSTASDEDALDGQGGHGETANVGCRVGNRSLTTPSLLTAAMALIGLGFLVGLRRTGNRGTGGNVRTSGRWLTLRE